MGALVHSLGDGNKIVTINNLANCIKASVQLSQKDLCLLNSFPQGTGQTPLCLGSPDPLRHVKNIK